MRTYGTFPPLAVLLLASTCLPLSAQTSAPNLHPVQLKLVAMDSAGHPVTDLAAADFAVYDNGAQQHILSMQLNQSDQPQPLVLLFDLLNAGEVSRGAVTNALKNSLARIRSNGPLYLYLLTEDGSLYPVHALPDPHVAPGPRDDAWLKDAGPLLERALQRVTQIKPQDFRASSPVFLEAHFKATFGALDQLRVQMAHMPGPKELLWISYGIPSAIHMADRTWFDAVPYLRQLGAAFVQAQTTVYTADPGLNLQVGALNRDSLAILAGVTGGHAYSTIDLERAIARIEAGSRTNYSLVFEPGSTRPDGKYHKLRITVARKGVHLETEHGYFAL